MRLAMISFGPVESRSNGYFIRSFYLSKALAESGNTVLILEFLEKTSLKTMEYKENPLFIHLQGNKLSLKTILGLKTNLTLDPLHLLYDQLYSLIELLRYRSYIKKCNAVFVEGALFPFGIFLTKMFKIKVILDTHCINSILARGYRQRNLFIYLIRMISWSLLERVAITLSNAIITVTEKEKDFIINNYNVKKSKIFVIPNMINPPNKVPYQVVKNLRTKLGLENKVVVTFMGDLQSIQNTDSVEYILEKLAPWFWTRRRDVLFLIIGKGSERFRHDLPNVIFTDFVEEVAPYLKVSDICIAPLRIGSGTKTKILEYLAFQKEVVTTPIGIEGLEMYNRFVFVSPIDDFSNALAKSIEKRKVPNGSLRLVQEDLFNIFKFEVGKLYSLLNSKKL